VLSVSGVPPTTAVVGNRGRQWGGVCEVTTVVGWWILKHKVGEGDWVKNPKPSCHGSVSGTPCEMAM
jgi:hypothetical protein